MTQWKLDKKIPIIVILALTGYAITGIAYAAYFKADIEHIKAAIMQYDTIPERLARLEQKTDDILLILKGH